MSEIKERGGEKKMELDILYTKEDIARRYTLELTTLNNWVSQGKIPYAKIGKKVLFPAREIERWEKQRFRPAIKTTELTSVIKSE
ncbi:MAG: helix-turn-helix domain-containing protein [Candidatus Omnitrophica bacterium]|nr:helix-turn-helix domain-containing protein [Candidatus Omnitrophota bacterium]MBU0881659.1 helix-turn-helix domain-containing protein [Candidatus Omnitrophota bacterium]MBU1808145.1 helix-turn-helix domain-containing protein [Candidatus Omnitrophota bacterium]